PRTPPPMEPDAAPEANLEPPAGAGAEPSGSSVASAPSALGDTLVAVPPPPLEPLPALADTLVAVPPPPSPGFPAPSFPAPSFSASPFAARPVEAPPPVAPRRPASTALLVVITLTSLA